MELVPNIATNPSLSLLYIIAVYNKELCINKIECCILLVLV